jgi:hypothetical protein
MSNGEDSQPGQSIPEGSNPAQPGGAADPATVAPPPPPAPPMVAPPTVPMAGSGGPGRYPVDLGIEAADRIARWRPLVQWILAIPLYVAVYVLRIVAQVFAVIGWFVALFTGQLPDGLGNFIAGYYRYYWRVSSYALFLRETYPPFGLAQGYGDPGGDPAWFAVRRPEGLSRLAVLFRIILVIPQLIVLFFLGIALYVVIVVAFFAVLFTGRWPEGLRDFVVGVMRWVLRVDAWFLLLADPYPPFSLH